MAEALASLGVAASIAQFVMIGIKAASFIQKAYESADGLIQEQQEMLAISRNIQESCRILQADHALDQSHGIADLLQASRELATDLERELNTLKRASDTGYIYKVRQSLRSMRKKSRIENMQHRLFKLRDQIFYILLSTSRQTESTFKAKVDTFESKVDTSAVAQGLESISERLRDLEACAVPQSRFDTELSKIIVDLQSLITRASLRRRMEGILKSLHFKNISERLSEVKSAHRSTFKWSLHGEKTSLPAWLESGQGIYWVEGKAGSGKSTLMKFLTTEDKTSELLKGWAAGRPLVVINHFFWSPGTDLQRGLNGLYRTLLSQILMECPELIEATCPERMNKSKFKHLESWTPDELDRCFQRLSASDLPAKICIFIDGLDEFRGNPNTLITVVNSIARSKDMKLCVSSRPWVEFQQAFSHLSSQLHLHHLTTDDIVRYVRDNLDQDKQYRLLRDRFPTDSHSFQSDIASRADGVFLWVYLVVRSLLRGLQSGDDISILRKRLEEFPTELEEYFKAMLNTIDSVYWTETSQIFSMLVLSKTPIPLPLVIASQLAHDESYEFQQLCCTTGARDPSAEATVEKACENLATSVDQIYNHLGASLRSTDFLADMERKISARCKDLVHFNRRFKNQSYETTVGFLHRSVSDFLTLRQVEAILVSRLRGSFEPRLALAGGNFMLMLIEVCQLLYAENCPDRVRHFQAAEDFYLWALYLTSQLRDRATDLYDVAMFFLATTIQHRSFKESILRIQEGDTPGRDVISGLYHPYYKNLTSVSYLLARLGLEVPPFICRVVGKYSPVGAAMEISSPHTFPPSPRLILRGSVIRGLEIKSWREDELGVRELSMVNLERLESILESNEGVRLYLMSSHSNGGWIDFLLHLTATNPYRHPENIYEACQLLISHGAPRYLYFDANSSADFNDQAWCSDHLPMSRVEFSKNSDYGDPRGQEFGDPNRIWSDARARTRKNHPIEGWIEIDSARVLDQIPKIASKNANGMQSMFQSIQNLPEPRKSERDGGMFEVLHYLLGFFS